MVVSEIDHFPLIRNPSFRIGFEKKFRVAPTGCWVWIAAKDYDNYGIVRVRNAGTKRAHRVAYEMYRGERIPAGMDIDHTCGVRECVNPDHLEVVLHYENMQRIRRRQEPEEAWVNGDQPADRIEPENTEKTEEEHEDAASPATPPKGAFWAGSPQKRASKALQDRLLEDAIEWLSAQRWPVPDRADGYGVASRPDAPWRAAKAGKFARIALFLDLVRIGVPWSRACKELLGLSTVTLLRWRANPFWLQDFTEAREEGRKNRLLLLEEQILTEMEKKLPLADYRELAESLKKLRERDDERNQGNASSPKFTFVFGSASTDQLQRVLEIGESIDAEYQRLPEGGA